MVRTRLFVPDGSQAVRLHKDVEFPKEVREVEIIRDQRRRLIVPADSAWDDFFDQPGVDLGSREQPSAPTRNGI